MNAPNDSPDVLAFRLERMRRAPRNWATWIGAFTLVNGLLVAAEVDLIFLAGAVAPFLLGGWLPHLVVGALLLAMARAVPSSSWGPVAVLVVYGKDTVLCGVLGLWTGVFMHLAVFVLLGMAWTAKASLERMHREAMERQSMLLDTREASSCARA